MAAIFRRSISVWRLQGDVKSLVWYVKPQLAVICSVGIWTLAGVQVQAQTENSVFLPPLEDGNSQSDLTEPVTPVAELDNLHPAPDLRRAGEAGGEENTSPAIGFVAPVERRGEKTKICAEIACNDAQGVLNFKPLDLIAPPALFLEATSTRAGKLGGTGHGQEETYPMERWGDWMMGGVEGTNSPHPPTPPPPHLPTPPPPHHPTTPPPHPPTTPPPHRSTLFERNSVLIAAPENFNPGLRLPPVPPPEAPTPPAVPTPPTTPKPPSFVIENLQTDFRDDRDSVRQHNQFIEPTAQFRLPNGQRLRVKTGFNTFEKPGFDSVTNIPIQLGWEGNIGKYTLRVDGGVDLFNRLPTALNFNTNFNAPVYVNLTPDNKLKSGLFVSGIFEQGPYKANAQSLDRQITASRLGPNIYWQIDPKTSFFSLYRWGFYNDGNYEQQSFSRLERKLGSFFIAANLFTWSYRSDRQNTSGYFSPPDFLNYNGEIGWDGDIFRFLRCRLTANYGQQRLLGTFEPGSTYQARCTAIISPNIEADFGYAYSNVRNLNTGGSGYNNRTLSGQLRVKF